MNARAYLNIAIESRFAPMMLLAVFKKVQYKLLMHRLAQMNVRFALMNSKRCSKMGVGVGRGKEGGGGMKLKRTLPSCVSGFLSSFLIMTGCSMLPV